MTRGGKSMPDTAKPVNDLNAVAHVNDPLAALGLADGGDRLRWMEFGPGGSR